ncbi:bacillithiol biosynthesis cysteine-adding enzyme BshC [Foetidibacter luteolus]|uniref:bacillithiol biosynthesis cysteine-adding enzyme BshC n=1 Tax=Foetidibacter luteolus TaxID=2608880 RepID=UPI00129A1E09|nr:bacillithiol biosynthesis cysteine-adding enzyme BshC [Foetidibacter luteolus]
MHHNNNLKTSANHITASAPTAEVVCSHIAYNQTGFFSKTVTDYLSGQPGLQQFYTHAPNLQGIKDAIAQRQHIAYNRNVLMQQLTSQYHGLPLAEKLEANLQLLLQNNTYTVTTAHQPNIFTGPLYFVYKILHAIQLADSLHQQLPDYNFVPVYYMGSEDADLDELGTITINGKKYTWQTKQTGAVGRMKIDKPFLSLITEMEGQLGVLPYGKEIAAKFRQAYKEKQTIQQASLELINDLFGHYGLVILVPDNAKLKELFIPVIEKELTEQFSYKAVTQTLQQLEQHGYKVQAGGRELNLFYLTEDKRERIERQGNDYAVNNLGLTFTQQEILAELRQHPERFSPNVILRGALQETLLPNIAFIGGGGELAYWLELKGVFQAAEVPYPVLILRNSFLLVPAELKKKTESIGITLADLFEHDHELMNKIVTQRSNKPVGLNGQLSKVGELYDGIMDVAVNIDASLHDHVMALRKKALQRLEELEKKMLRAEKRKFGTEKERIEKIKAVLFPNNNLQERVENLAGFYAVYGEGLIDLLLENSLTLEQQFSILVLS